MVHIHYGNITQLLNKQTNKTKQTKQKNNLTFGSVPNEVDKTGAYYTE